MKKIALMLLLSLTLAACEQQDRPSNQAQIEEDSGKTEKNTQDSESETKKTMNPSTRENDRKITQKIRRAIISDDLLSADAKNIRILTMNGVVTLRGSVADSDEKRAIIRKTSNIQGVVKINNFLEDN